MRPPTIDDLRRGMCHLWWWRPDAGPADAFAERGLKLLSDDELARYRRFLVPRPAETFLAARVLLRSLLSRYADVRPGDWRFEANPWGRPRIANAGIPRGLSFNLSHKPGCVVCLVGYGRALGADVEDMAANRTNLLELADRFFSRSESAELRRLPAEQHCERFFELWTLKESYIKARGIGLSLGLSRFSFTPAGDTASVRFDANFHDDPADWEFCLFRPTPQHMIATAVERLAGLPATVEMRDATELIRQAVL